MVWPVLLTKRLTLRLVWLRLIVLRILLALILSVRTRIFNRWLLVVSRALGNSVPMTSGEVVTAMVFRVLCPIRDVVVLKDCIRLKIVVVGPCSCLFVVARAAFFVDWPNSGILTVCLSSWTLPSTAGRVTFR